MNPRAITSAHRPFFGEGFMTTGELPPGNSGLILTRRPVEGRFGIQRYQSDQSPPAHVEFLSGRRGDASTQQIHKEEP